MYDKLFDSLFEIVTFSNRPTQDKKLLETAGVRLDSALFTLLVRIGRSGPVGVVELADQVGRDYSTVSRQVDKLVDLQLVTESIGSKDKRVRELSVSGEGKKLLAKIKRARHIVMKEFLADWSENDIRQLDDSLSKLAAAMLNYAKQ